MDMSIALTLERYMQTSLLVVPLVVLLAWCMRIDTMTPCLTAFQLLRCLRRSLLLRTLFREVYHIGLYYHRHRCILHTLSSRINFCISHKSLERKRVSLSLSLRVVVP
ncbi:hypothetical protein AOQ84DRAFT_183199 [Glonium stellatum]|uniref:Uncharacterized protein n=1 Tax=Glonium stellatum TaxID=574774 RepID=A0A8E2FD99_9PEZI|nr:hypothetical protein AOQ84DRAFT_183199 [Glonium stellatum]